MSQQTDYKFHVVELFDPPYTDPQRYVCIPNSWIRLRETSNGVVMVKFPNEELSEVKKRVKNEEFSDNWAVFVADIKYSTNSYLDASDYVKILNKISFQEQNVMKTVENIPSTSGKIAIISQPDSETNEVHTTSTLSKDAEPANKQTTEQLDLTDAEVEICQEKSRVEIVDSIPKPRRYLTRQSLRMPSSANNSVVLLDQAARDNHPDTSNCVEKSDKIRNQQNKSSVKNRPELTKKLQILLVLRSVLGDDFKAVMKQLHNEYVRNHLILKDMQLAFMRNCKIIEELIELTDEVINDPDISDLDATVKKLENNMMDVDTNENDSDEVNKLEEQNDAPKEKKKKPNSDDREVKNNNPLNKIRGQARKFTLPPEYDRNDSRWTLKHRKKKKGLVELVPHSRVYVDAIKLSNCKRMSKESKTLARSLLLEIFSRKALSICSLTGKKANAFDLEGTSVRPGLDEHARTVLLNYVDKHAIEKNWVKLDTVLISSTLRNKIQEIRGKYG